MRLVPLSSSAATAALVVALLAGGLAGCEAPPPRRPQPYRQQVAPAPEPVTEVIAYPAQGQSEQQLDRDRYECHQWSVKQTGFDPTQPQGGVGNGQMANKRADYQRAQGACLEARGYTVK